MPRLPRVTAARIIRVLERQGFELARESGSHKIYQHPDGRRTTVPYHAGKIVRPKTLKSILADVQLSVAEFANLLRKK